MHNILLYVFAIFTAFLAIFVAWGFIWVMLNNYRADKLNKNCGGIYTPPDPHAETEIIERVK